MESYDNLVKKWAPVLNEETAGPITDKHRKSVTAVVLENQEKALVEERGQQNFLAETPANTTASANNWDPVLISLVRRSMPNMIAYDLCGVQPMTGPTGLIFAMKSRYSAGTTGSTEALFNEADTTFSGDSSATQGSAGPSGLEVTNANSAHTIDSDRVTTGFDGAMPTADG